ncbi:MAG: DUF4157 domain-containing protein [Methanothrix sp.]|nr:DUF4157 domain-containing protein [Methanothrix sp.]
MAIQAKLIVGPADDEYEKEADRVAEHVMSMREPVTLGKLDRAQRQLKEEEEEDKVQTKPIAKQITPLVQRQLEQEEVKGEPVQTKQDEYVQQQVMRVAEEEEAVRKKRSNEGVLHFGPSLEAQIRSIRGGGQSLAESARRFYEPRFRYNFSQVRIHSDGFASELAKTLNARAFTVGRDIIFGKECGASGAKERSHLLSHELAHVIQQDRRSSKYYIQKKEKAKTSIDPEFDLKLILGPVEEKSIVLGQETLLNLYKYLKLVRRLAPKEEPLTKYFLNRYFQKNWEKIWVDSMKPLAGYKGASHGKSGRGLNILAGAPKALEKAEELGVLRVRQRTWKKFLSSDVIFLSGHHYARYGSPGEFEDVNLQELKFVSKNVKLIIISSCAGLSPNTLRLWKNRFPNAYILGWRSGSPENQRGLIREFLQRLPKDLILERKEDMDIIINEWKAYIENLAKTSGAIRPYGLGYATPEGSINWYTQSNGKWFWARKQ